MGHSRLNVRYLWKLGGQHVTPGKHREHVLGYIAHSSVAPGGVEHMSLQKLIRTFSRSTVEHYLDDWQRRQDTSFHPDGQKILAIVHDLVHAQPQVNSSVLDIQQKLAQLTADPANTGINGEYKWPAWKNTHDAIFDPRLSEYTGAALLDQSELAGDFPFKANIKAGLNIITTFISKIEELRELGGQKNQEDPDKFLRTLTLIEEESKLHKPSKGSPEPSVLEHLLARAQKLAATKAFSTDSLLYEVAGGADFLRTISTKTKAAIQANRTADSKVHHKYYESFSKLFEGFARETFGMVLFAHPGKKPLEEWSVEDVAQLREFAQNRFAVLHEVIEGIANKNKNPLGANIDDDQLVPLMHEVLRSSLYPNYKLNIRIGIGGTKEEDVLVRAGAYIMNALDVMTIFDSVKGVNVPRLTIVSGAELSAPINGLNVESAAQNGRKILSFLESFAAEFYPDLKDRISYEYPTQNDIFNRPISQLLLDTARDVVSAPEDKSNINGAFKTLVHFACRHSGQASDGSGNVSEAELEAARERALAYAAAHVGPATFATVYSSDNINGPVWKIGGKGEKPFNSLQRAITEALIHRLDAQQVVSPANAIGPQPVVLCTTTTVGGDPPPYYRGGSSTVDFGLNELQTSGAHPDSKIKRILSEKNGPAADMCALVTHPRIGNGDAVRGWAHYEKFLLACKI